MPIKAYFSATRNAHEQIQRKCKEKFNSDNLNPSRCDPATNSVFINFSNISNTIGQAMGIILHEVAHLFIRTKVGYPKSTKIDSDSMWTDEYFCHGASPERG